MSQAHSFISMHMWMQVGAGHAFSISCYHLDLCIVLGHVCDCPCIEESMLSRFQAERCFVSVNSTTPSTKEGVTP